MMGEFREMSEAALSRLKDSPALIDSVVLAGLPIDDAIPRFEAFLQSLPTSQREMMRGLYASGTPEQQAEMERLARSIPATGKTPRTAVGLRKRSRRLCGFYANVAARGNAVLLYLS